MSDTDDAARTNPQGLSFNELQRLVEAVGFRLARKSGSHHVYTCQGVTEIVNLQPKGKAAKVYQVRQVLDLIDKYELKIE